MRDALLGAAFAGAFAAVLWRLRALARPGPAAGLLAAFGLAVLAFQPLPPRGGYDNEHDFSLLSTPGPSAPARWLRSDKEAAPQLVFWLADGSGSLSGVLAAQKLVWLLAALLAGAALLRLGAGPEAAAAAAALAALNPYALLSAHGFSTTPANVFFVLAAVLAVAELHAAEGPRPPFEVLGGFAAASLLVWGARYELLPPLLLGAALAPWRRWRWTRRQAAAFAALAAVWLLAAAFWALRLRELTHYNGPQSASRAMTGVFGTLAHHLGGPAGAAAAVALALWGLAQRRRWTAFLAAWTFYNAAVYAPLAEYPLQFVRHHLYVALPVILLAATAVGRHWPRSPRGRAALAASLLAVGLLGAARLRSLRGERRTNDEEWAFLLRASRDWPRDCVLTGAVGYNRWPTLSKYFPTAKAGSGGPCELVYRSPNYQVIRMPGEDQREAERLLLGDPVREETVTHRFYTAWRGDGSLAETTEPKSVTMGLYRRKRL